MNVVVVTLFAALFMQIGYFCWKITADKMADTSKFKNKNVILNYLYNPLWMSGMLATSIGWLLFVKATNIGEISIVQPLMSVGDLFLVIVAVFYLKERLNIKEWIGIMLTVLGAFVLAFEAKEILTEHINFIPLTFLILASFGIFLNFVIKRKLPSSEIILSLLIGFAFGEGALLTELLTSSKNIFSEMSAWQISIVLINLLGVVFANICGIILMQIAFKKGRAAVIIPIQLAIANIVVVVGANLIFSEKINAIRLIGIFCIIVGTALLYRLNAKEK